MQLQNKKGSLLQIQNDNKQYVEHPYQAKVYDNYVAMLATQIEIINYGQNPNGQVKMHDAVS